MVPLLRLCPINPHLLLACLFCWNMFPFISVHQYYRRDPTSDLLMVIAFIAIQGLSILIFWLVWKYLDLSVIEYNNIGEKHDAKTPRVHLDILGFLHKLLHCVQLAEGGKLRVWTNQRASCSCM